MNRGLHVNVIEGKKSFHVALEAIMYGEIPKGIKLVPADLQARKIGISKKVEEAIRDYMEKNKSKLSNIARMAAEAFTGSDLSRKQGLQDVAKALDVH